MNRREFLIQTGLVTAGCLAGGLPEARSQGVSATAPRASANSVRSVMRLFASDVEDKAWYGNRDFWKRYFALLAESRFSRFQLALGLGYDGPKGLRDTYFYFPYPFLLSVPGYDVRADRLPDAERDHNLEMLRFMSDEAAANGLEFQLGLWTHAYEWIDSPDANYLITGLTPDSQAPYCRDALAAVLKACPKITGVTFRIHGESGVPEGSYDIWKKIFDGCVRSGRRIGIDMHAKGMDQPTIDAAMATGLPITISPKFWAEHMGLPYHQGAIRPTEMPKRARGSGPFAQSEGSRSFLRYGFGDLLKEDRPYGIVYRIWPGTQRLLLSGDPVFTAAYGRASSFCGGQGCEIFDPLSFKGRKGSGLPRARTGYADPALRPTGGDFEKYRYTYLLWGRLLDNPDAEPETWREPLRRSYGKASVPVEKALSHASRILPLLTTAHLPSASNNNFWPEMYVNMSIVEASDGHPYTDTPSPKRFGTVSPLDTQFFSRIDDFADGLLSGRPLAKYTPLEVAQWLEDSASVASEQLAAAVNMGEPSTAEFSRMAIDVQAQVGLGRFFAHKLRSGVLFALAETTGEPSLLHAALTAYKRAREAWVGIAKATEGAYLEDVTFGDGWFQRGHWSDRLKAIDKDIAAMANVSLTQSTAESSMPATVLLALVDSRFDTADPKPEHTPPGSFRRGQAVPVHIGPTKDGSDVVLHYRHANQAEAWSSVPMTKASNGFSGEIPAAATDSAYPITYYFEFRVQGPRTGLFPGLGEHLCGPPYFTVRSA